MHSDASAANAPNGEVGEYQSDVSFTADQGIALIDVALRHPCAAMCVSICDDPQMLCLAQVPQAAKRMASDVNGAGGCGCPEFVEVHDPADPRATTRVLG